MAELVQKSARDAALSLYFQGYTITQVARRLEMARSTVESWRKRENWDGMSDSMRLGVCIRERMAMLIAMDKKEDCHLKEIETLGKILERTARIAKFEKTEKEADLNPNINKRNEGKKKRQKKKNQLSDEQVQMLRDDFHSSLFGYQIKWHWARYKKRRRAILKSRQIGATWYFAREALLDAVENGDNQVFMSASKAQALLFREYVVQWVIDVCDVTLTGDPIQLANGANLYFLSTSKKTAQGYHGHVYMDEFFWIQSFAEFKKVTSAMASHKKWTLTFFSTPSAVSHEAYPFWTGEEKNKGRTEDDKIAIDVSHSALKDGADGEDGMWRHIVTVEDAEQLGCDLFDIDDLKIEYSDEEYANLYMCQFIDDHVSFFKLAKLQKCLVDSMMDWPDFDPFSDRPFGDRAVWIGYDPSRTRDDASIVVVAPPDDDKGFYRVLEKLTFRNKTFEDQAQAIRALTERYHVTHIGIDKSSIGLAVFEMVQNFFPAVQGVSYSVEVKNRLVLKIHQIVSRDRLRFDAGMTDLISAFMSIRQTTTASGRQSTFQASRTNETGHADGAWAVMHAVQHEGLDAVIGDGSTKTKSIVEII